MSLIDTNACEASLRAEQQVVSTPRPAPVDSFHYPTQPDRVRDDRVLRGRGNVLFFGHNIVIRTLCSGERYLYSLRLSNLTKLMRGLCDESE